MRIDRLLLCCVQNLSDTDLLSTNRPRTIHHVRGLGFEASTAFRSVTKSLVEHVCYSRRHHREKIVEREKKRSYREREHLPLRVRRNYAHTCLYTIGSKTFNRNCW